MLKSANVDKKPEKQRGGGKKESRFMLRVDDDWVERVERQANRFGLTVAAYIRQAASKQLEIDEATDPSEK